GRQQCEEGHLLAAHRRSAWPCTGRDRGRARRVGWARGGTPRALRRGGGPRRGRAARAGRVLSAVLPRRRALPGPEGRGGRGRGAGSADGDRAAGRAAAGDRGSAAAGSGAACAGRRREGGAHAAAVPTRAGRAGETTAVGLVVSRQLSVEQL